jgi:tetratricopeptide (TPR) repeat protein
VGAYERAVAADPGFAPAWAGLAVSLAGLADRSASAEEVAELKRRAIEAADRVVTLGPDLPDGYWARGFVRAGILWDWDGARADFERSLALNPRRPETLRRYGTWYLGAVGRNAEGVAAVRRAAELDPLLVYAWTDLALLHLRTGNLDEAGKAISRALEIDPENRFAIRHLVVKNLLEKRPQAALEAAERISDPPWRLMSTALSLQALGRTAESRTAVEAMERDLGHAWAFQIAQVHAFRGETDAAFQWLDRALEQRDSGLVLEVKGDPLLSSVREDPRFGLLLARLNLPPD